MEEWMWFALAAAFVLAVCWYFLWKDIKAARTRDDWPHDDSLGG